MTDWLYPNDCYCDPSGCDWSKKLSDFTQMTVTDITQMNDYLKLMTVVDFT